MPLALLLLVSGAVRAAEPQMVPTVFICHLKGETLTKHAVHLDGLKTRHFFHIAEKDFHRVLAVGPTDVAVLTYEVEAKEPRLERKAFEAKVQAWVLKTRFTPKKFFAAPDFGNYKFIRGMVNVPERGSDPHLLVPTEGTYLTLEQRWQHKNYLAGRFLDTYCADWVKWLNR